MDIGEILGRLDFNTSTFIFSTINFVIVFAILWKFVFGRLGKIIDERQQKIKAGLEDAERVALELNMAEKKADEIIDEAKKKANSIIVQAQEDANALTEKKMKEAQKSIDDMKQKSKKAMEIERRNMIDKIKQQTADLAILATEKIISEKFDKEADKKIINDYLSNLDTK